MRSTLQVKILLGSLLLALLLSIAICTVSYINYKDSLIERYTTVATESAVLARNFVDGDRIAEYLATRSKDDYYFELHDRFDEIKAAFELMFLYIHIPDGEYIDYVIDAWAPGDNPTAIADLGEFDVMWKGSRDIIMNTFQNGPPEGVVYIDDEEYGYIATALLPVYNSDGAITALIGADISMDMVIAKLNNYLIRISLITLGIVFGFILAALWAVRKGIINPLHLLAQAAGSFANGDIPLSFKRVEIRSRDELYTLACAYNKMADDIIAHVENIKQVTAEKERIGAELTVATQIQASMLPNIFPAFPKRKDFDIYATMHPAKEVGGDFYDFFLIDDETLALVMADVSGKGVPSALFMVVAKTLLKNNAQLGKSPKEVMEAVNNILCENNDACMFVTAFLGYLDIPTGRFTYVNAGHNQPLVRNKERLLWLKEKPDFVLAGIEDTAYTQHEITLRSGDEIFMYTDGVTEAMNKDDELFGDVRLFETANRCADLPLSEFVQSIKKELDIFAAGAEQADDITMLALRYEKAEEAIMTGLLIEAKLENMDEVLDFVGRRLGGQSTLIQSQIAVVVDEVFSNIARYAYNPDVGSVVVRIVVGEDITLEFEDSGVAFDPLASQDPDTTLSDEDRDIGGLGLYIVKDMMDTVEYLRKGNKNILTIKKRLG